MKAKHTNISCFTILNLYYFYAKKKEEEKKFSKSTTEKPFNITHHTIVSSRHLYMLEAAECLKLESETLWDQGMREMLPTTLCKVYYTFWMRHILFVLYKYRRIHF